MKSGTTKTLIAGAGLVALGTVALTKAQKRRHASAGMQPTLDSNTEMDQTGMGQSSAPMPDVMEMPAAAQTEKPGMVDPAIE